MALMVDINSEVEVEAEFEMNVDLDLREPGPVDGETLDSHSDAVADVLEEKAGDLALGLAISLGIQNSTIGLRFDLLGDEEAEIYEKLAEVIRIIERETKLGLRVSRVEMAEIDAEARAAELARLRGSDEGPRPDPGSAARRLAGCRWRRRGGHQLDPLAAL
jgi:hypothetical protein